MNSSNLSKIKNIIIYSPFTTGTLDILRVIDFIKDSFPGMGVEHREPFLGSFSNFTDLEVLATKLAGAKVLDPAAPVSPRKPLYGEVGFEKRLLEHPEKHIPGILYDGFEFSSILREKISLKEAISSKAHIIFTHRLLASFDGNDRRYHIRAVILGYPSILSIPGIVQGPARPREYYLVKRSLAPLASDPIALRELEKTFQGRFIGKNDERLTQVVKGYVLQALFYHLFGEPFCEKRDCRLFNAHWQKDLIHAQRHSGILCDRHFDMLRTLLA